MAGNNVPGLDSAPQESLNVPGVQFPLRQEFGKEGRAFESLGQNIEQAAGTVGQIGQEISRQHDISTASSAAVDMSLKHSQLSQSLQLSSPDGFVRDPSTNEIITDKAGKQRTIAQEYWDHANQDYTSAQDKMTPQAAAMFREKMLPEIARNTQRLQGEGMRLQAQSTEQNLGNIKDSWAKDFQLSPVPSVNPYYTTYGDDGSTKQYPSAQKFFNAVQDAQLTRQQMGPIEGKSPGFYGPTEVEALKKKDGNELANNWLSSMKDDMVSSSGSRAALHQQLKDASSTSTMQLHSMLDIVNGKDPETKRREDAGLPTINSSLTPEKIHEWNNTLLAMQPAAKSVDKSEYELFKTMVGEKAKGAHDFVQFTKDPLVTRTVQMGIGLGETGDQVAQGMVPHLATALQSASLSKIGSISSSDSQRWAANEELKKGEAYLPQFLTSLGMDPKNAALAQGVLTAGVPKALAEKLDENERKMADPMAYAQQTRPGPNGQAVPIDRDSHAIKNQLDPNVNQGAQSALAIFQPMGNSGKSVWESAQANANSAYSRMFKTQVGAVGLSNEQTQNQVKQLMHSTPETVNSYLNLLQQQRGTAAQKENFLQNLVKKGDMPETWYDAMKLKEPEARAARFSQLMAGPSAMPEGETKAQVETLSQQQNKDFFNYLRLRGGANSASTTRDINTYDQSWQETYKQARNRGLGTTEATDFTNGQRDHTTSDIGTVQAPHHFWNSGSAGPAVTVEFGTHENGDRYTPEEKQKIQDTLLYYQSKEGLSKNERYGYVQPPGFKANPNAASDPDRIAAQAKFWRRVGGGWQLNGQETDKNNISTGNTQGVFHYVGDSKIPYWVTEDEALAGPPTGAQKSVPPPPKLMPNPGFIPNDR